jgi:hypothetical protein
MLESGEKVEIKPTTKQKEHIEQEMKFWEKTKGQLQLTAEVSEVFLKYLFNIYRNMLAKPFNPAA